MISRVIKKLSNHGIATLVMAIVALIALIPPFLEFFFKKEIDIEKQFEEKFSKWAIEESFGSSVYLVGFQKIVGVDNMIKNPSECFFRILIKNSDGDWIEERSVAATSNGIIPFRNLIPGTYRAELVFYENILAREENIIISRNRSEFVRLVTRGAPGRLRFRIVGNTGEAKGNNVLSIYSKDGTIFREDSVGANGITESFWVPSLGIDTSDFYIAKVYDSRCKEHLLGTSEKLQPFFKYTEQLMEINLTIR